MAKSNIKLESIIFLMFYKKNQLEERIRELEERSKHLEEKTKQATEILENLVSEFDDFQDMILLGRANPSLVRHQPLQPEISQNPGKVISFKEPVAFLKPGMIDMSGTPEENNALREGWWQSEGNFRWGGMDSIDAALYFEVSDSKEYELAAKIFVPRALAGKPITLLANGIKIADFVSPAEAELEKKITIPSCVTSDGKLKIVFRSDFWKPRDIDPAVDDDRVLSIAFNYVSLSEKLS